MQRHYNALCCMTRPDNTIQSNTLHRHACAHACIHACMRIISFGCALLDMSMPVIAYTLTHRHAHTAMHTRMPACMHGDSEAACLMHACIHAHACEHPCRHASAQPYTQTVKPDPRSHADEPSHEHTVHHTCRHEAMQDRHTGMLAGWQPSI